MPFKVCKTESGATVELPNGKWLVVDSDGVSLNSLTGSTTYTEETADIFRGLVELVLKERGEL